LKKSQGKTKEEIFSDPEVQKHQNAHAKAETEYEDLQKQIGAKEAEISGHQKNIATYKIELTNIQRSIKDLEGEAATNKAKMAIAKEVEGINDVLAGIATDEGDKDLEAVRDAVARREAGAQISAELAGTDTRREDAEYENFASTSQASADFMDFLDLDEDKEAEKPLGPAKLPE
jgi:phage shock protein A